MKSSLAYLGVIAPAPPNFLYLYRAPTVNDYRDYRIGTIWLVKNTESIYMLTDKKAGIATWSLLGGGGAGTMLLAHTDVGDATVNPVDGSIIWAGGDNMNTAGAVNTVTLNLNTSILQPITSADGTAGLYALGGNDFLHAYGTHNTFLGQSAGNRVLTVADAKENCGIGYQTLSAITTASYNTAVGDASSDSLLSGEDNASFGSNSLGQSTDSDQCIAFGSESLNHLLTGDRCIAIGYESGSAYTGAESHNITIDNIGVLGESNKIRIGTVGTHDECFIAGVYGATIGATKKVAMVDNTGRLAGSTGGTDGMILISATGAPPEWRTLTAGAGVGIVSGTNSITISAGGGAGGMITAHTDVGDATIDGANAITWAGTAPIATSGAVNTVTIGMTNGTNGQVLIGGGASPVWASITSAGGTVTITPGAGTLNIEAAGVASTTTFATDTAGPVFPLVGVINVLGGSNITTDGTVANTVTVDMDQSILQPLTNVTGTTGVYALGTTDYVTDRFLHSFGNFNVYLGNQSGNIDVLSTGADNTAVGSFCLNSVSSGSSNSIVGSDGALVLDTGSNNSGLGFEVLSHITSATSNSALGFQSLNGIVSGTNNIGLGYQSGHSLTGADSSNILIGHAGSAGLNNTIRIGTQGAGAGQQNATYIAGVYNTAIGATTGMVSIDSTGKLGSSNGTDGQILIGGGTAPTWGVVTQGTGITITNAPNSITVAADGSAANTFNTDGAAATVAANTITIAGGTNITTAGAGSTVTVNLDASPILAGSLTVGTALTVNSFAAGALVSSAAGVVTSINGTAGYVLTSNGAGVVPTWQAGAGGAAVNSVTAGTNMNLTGTAADPIINLNDAVYLPATNAAGTSGLIGISGGRFLHAYGSCNSNTFCGYLSGNLTASTSTWNTGIGNDTLSHIVNTTVNNTAVGARAASYLQGTSSQNVAIGFQAMKETNFGGGTASSDNVAIGVSSMFKGNGQRNIAIGQLSGTNVWGSAVSVNDAISIGTQWIDTNTTRIGYVQTAAYMAGIYNQTPGTGSAYVKIGSDGKFGTVWSPNEISFFAYKTANTPNATGDGTYVYFTGLTELYDPGADFNPTTGIFTAPVTGRYIFSAMVSLYNLIIPPPAPPPPTYVDPLDIITTSRTFTLINPVLQYLGTQSIHLTVMGQMTAGQTMRAAYGVNVTAIGKTIGIAANTTWMSGYLLSEN